MKPEILFLKYAFPCSIVLKQKGEITQETFDRLEKSAISNKLVERQLLEKIYFRAIARMKTLAKEKNKYYFSERIIREYFTKRHNKIISMDKKVPSALKHLCKVFKSRVIKKGSNYYIVEYNNKKTRPVLSSLLPNAQIGDIVTIHYGYAVEKVN